MFNLYYDNLFPSAVVYADFEQEINDDVINFSRDLVKQNKEVPFYSSCISTVKTSRMILEMPEFKNIKQRIVDCLGAFCDRQKIRKEGLAFGGSWLNLYEKHGYQDLHLHSDSMISGVFYIKSAGNKDLIFQAPWHFSQPLEPEYEEITIQNCHNVEYPSTQGRCYIFLSHMLHRTLPATDERISLSFNVKYKE